MSASKSPARVSEWEGRARLGRSVPGLGPGRAPRLSSSSSRETSHPGAWPVGHEVWYLALGCLHPSAELSDKWGRKEGGSDSRPNRASLPYPSPHARPQVSYSRLAPRPKSLGTKGGNTRRFRGSRVTRSGGTAVWDPATGPHCRASSLPGPRFAPREVGQSWPGPRRVE